MGFINTNQFNIETVQWQGQTYFCAEQVVDHVDINNDGYSDTIAHRPCVSEDQFVNADYGFCDVADLTDNEGSKLEIQLLEQPELVPSTLRVKISHDPNDPAYWVPDNGSSTRDPDQFSRGDSCRTVPPERVVSPLTEDDYIDLKLSARQEGFYFFETPAQPIFGDVFTDDVGQEWSHRWVLMAAAYPEGPKIGPKSTVTLPSGAEAIVTSLGFMLDNDFNVADRYAVVRHQDKADDGNPSITREVYSLEVLTPVPLM